MRAFVTGASGFVGQYLSQLLLDRSWEVTCLVRRTLTPARPGLVVVPGDLQSPESLAPALAAAGPIDAVFHLGALLPSRAVLQSAAYVTANTTATLALIEACIQQQISRFVYLSSISVIGEPIKVPIAETHPLAPQIPYALSKLGGEFACSIARHRGIKATAFRLSSPYGPGMNQATVLPLFVRLARDGKPVRWHGSGSRSQDFIHVEDAARACLLAAERGASGVYCLGSGQPTSMRSLAKMVTTLLPGATAQASGEPDPQEGRSWQLDMSLARHDLGFKPAISIYQGLAQYIQATASPPCLWI